MSTIDDLFDSKEEALFQKSEAEWLRTPIADTLEDYGSSTLDGISDPKKRARCAKLIQREERDHARYMSEHAEKQKLHREKVRAKARVREAETLARANKPVPQPRMEERNSQPQPKTFPMGAEIMRRFNRKPITG